MNKIKQNFIAKYNNQRGSTILLITVLILSSVLVVTLTASEIIRIGLTMSKNQLDAAKAFYAAEAGAEKIIWGIRDGSLDPVSKGCLDDGNEYKMCFDGADVYNCVAAAAACGSYSDKQVLTNNAEFSIYYKYINPDTFIICKGKFKDVNRVVELRF